MHTHLYTQHSFLDPEEAAQPHSNQISKKILALQTGYFRLSNELTICPISPKESLAVLRSQRRGAIEGEGLQHPPGRCGGGGGALEGVEQQGALFAKSSYLSSHNFAHPIPGPHSGLTLRRDRPRKGFFCTLNLSETPDRKILSQLG